MYGNRQVTVCINKNLEIEILIDFWHFQISMKPILILFLTFIGLGGTSAIYYQQKFHQCKEPE